jgi:hypothetical protein
MKKTIDFSDKQAAYVEKLRKENKISFTEAVKRIMDKVIEEGKKTCE